MLVSVVARHGLAGIAAERLACLATVPPEAMSDLKALRRQQEATAAGHALMHAGLLAALAQSGVRAIPLKGQFLATRIYGSGGSRSSADFDILVERGDMARALAVVEQLGWASNDWHASRWWPPLHFTANGAARPSVELHWRVHWYGWRFALDMLRRAEPGPDGVLTATREDELIALLLYYARDGFVGYKLAADIAAWHDRFGAAPERLREVVGRHPGLKRSIESSLAIARQRVGIPLYLALDAGYSPRTRMASWLSVAAAAHPNEQQRQATVTLIDGVLAPSGELRKSLLRSLFRPAVQGWSRSDGWHRLYWTGHPLRILARWCLALGAPRG